MNLVSGKLSSKNQITVPKTIRDYLGVAEGDALEFVLKDGKVILKKSDDLQSCPFCWGEDFYDQPCRFCEGKGMVERVTADTLCRRLFVVFAGTKVQLDTTQETYRLEVLTDDELLRRYREYFQIEFIKIPLRKAKVQQLFNSELRDELTNLLEFPQSQEYFTNWWESLKRKNR